MIALLWRGVALFTPGGWIVSAVLAAGKFVLKFLYWLMADIADAFKEPWRFVVRTVCLIVILCVGVYLGMSHMREERDEWRNAHAQIIEDARKADAKNKHELTAALKAKADAEATLLVRKVRTVPAPAPAAGAKRMQPKRAAGG